MKNVCKSKESEKKSRKNCTVVKMWLNDSHVFIVNGYTEPGQLITGVRVSLSLDLRTDIVGLGLRRVGRAQINRRSFRLSIFNDR